MARGRPASKEPAWECHIHLRLREGEDADLIAFLKQIPGRRRASAVKSALRAGGMQQPASGNNSQDEELNAAILDFLK